jgi:deazaflavin-dependent oxidoreductase (nitroreductase family)
VPELAEALVEGRDLDFCYLVTTGRVTGRAHEIEIWFFEHGGRAYLLSGGGDRSDWVANLRRDPRVRLRVGTVEGAATARVVDLDEEELQTTGRRGLRTKYEPGYGGSLARWALESLLVEVAPGAPPV